MIFSSSYPKVMAAASALHRSVLRRSGPAGVKPGLKDGRRVGVLVEFVVAEQPQQTVVFVLGPRGGSSRVEENVGAIGLFGDRGQFGGVQHVEGMRA
ncbi:hypothetical protein [Streptomyces sp. NPDC057301]|uniref:hypothetical protein n=1 Tax=Streptomyces sp. NPDC057301 TaxID=3346093 RepID=UPI00362DEDEA